MSKLNKEDLAQLGISVLDKFCSVNDIKPPNIELSYFITDPLSIKIKRVGTCGYYRNNSIFVSVPLCSHQHPMYSWAGYISDRTPYGVIAHELGHYVDDVKSKECHQGFSNYIRRMSKEEPITSYSPNTQEWFAEIFRLFITNPDLLRIIRPIAYEKILEFGINPIITQDFIEILEGFSAADNIYKRLQEWIPNK